MPTLSDQMPASEPAVDSDGNAVLAQVARAVDAMRSGQFVRIGSRDGALAAVLAVEAADERVLRKLESGSPPLLLVLTHARARTLKLRLYTQDVVAIRLAPPLDAELLRAIADPAADLDRPLKGPFETVREMLPQSCVAAVRLAKLAGLLPAVLFGPAELALHAVELPTDSVGRYDALVMRSLKPVTRAQVPLAGAERAELIAFRSGNGEPEHYAILIGDPPTDRPVLARLHSECFTGDLLGSLRCDCGNQLRGAIAAIGEAGGGILIYLAQEGRGIGLVNKLRAYRLQDQGFDTLEANERLGFERDERLYGIAARMLALLGFNSVRLLTNNPAKVEALAAAGIEVVERVPLAFPANPHNLDYLLTKANKGGHLF